MSSHIHVLGECSCGLKMCCIPVMSQSMFCVQNACYIRVLDDVPVHKTHITLHTCSRRVLKWAERTMSVQMDKMHVASSVQFRWTNCMLHTCGGVFRRTKCTFYTVLVQADKSLSGGQNACYIPVLRDVQADKMHVSYMSWFRQTKFCQADKMHVTYLCWFRQTKFCQAEKMHVTYLCWSRQTKCMLHICAGPGRQNACYIPVLGECGGRRDRRRERREGWWCWTLRECAVSSRPFTVHSHKLSSLIRGWTRVCVRLRIACMYTVLLQGRGCGWGWRCEGRLACVGVCLRVC